MLIPKGEKGDVARVHCPLALGEEEDGPVDLEEGEDTAVQFKRSLSWRDVPALVASTLRRAVAIDGIKGKHLINDSQSMQKTEDGRNLRMIDLDG